MNKKILAAIIILFTLSAKAQQKVIQLYPGAAPGSESWTWNEAANDSNPFKEHLIYNVSAPTLTVFPADPGVAATGTAVIICPGGAFHWLSIEKEGYDVAAWLSKKGITAFVLKYRLEHTMGNDPVKELGDLSRKPGFNISQSATIPLAVADGRAAIAYVRAHATDYGIKPDQVGIIGFSAGGAVAALSAVNYTDDNKPDFAAPIYPYLTQSLMPAVPAGSPPLFIAAASDDQLNTQGHVNTNLYNAWIANKNDAEIHLYVKGGHGFGMSKQNIPTDTWIDRFADWLGQLGYLKPLSDVKSDAQKNAENFANYQKWWEGVLHNDWPWLTKYRDANTKVPPPAPGEKRVVFMGNSITENWGNMDTAFFKNNHYISRGIGGQVSSQMLVRFREDVINLKPAAVVISAGTNDIAQNRGYISLENIFGNIVSMAELAEASGIKPILTSVLPASEFSWHRGLEPAEKIITLNKMIKAYAAKNHLVYVDYWSAMVNDKKGLKVELAQDGLVHPNLAGYKVMEPLVKAGIDETLK
jgi:acetyl esterase/lipase/lysophospholipase L1-like esterase